VPSGNSGMPVTCKASAGMSANSLDPAQIWSRRLVYAQPRGDLSELLARCNAFQENRILYQLIDPD
jgi:hypothetical protein